MSEVTQGGSSFIGYEYKEVSVQKGKESIYADGFKSFGWIVDEHVIMDKKGKQSVIKLKRDRKILNKAELTRLQRNFEACMEEINELEKSKTSAATIMGITVGFIGTVFITLSTFAITHNPPLILPCILFAIPGFIGWGLPFFLYKKMVHCRTDRIIPLIEQKYDEIYELCEKGNHLTIATI